MAERKPSLRIVADEGIPAPDGDNLIPERREFFLSVVAGGIPSVNLEWALDRAHRLIENRKRTSSIDGSELRRN
jgi:hypothetical protein